MKLLSRTVLALYVVILLWLVLFKFSYDLHSIIANYQTRSLSLIPFITASRGTIREMIDNAIVFIPFGLLLRINFKQVSFWRKVAAIFMFSLVVETIQYVFAIGVSDTTDVIMNTFGGFVGLAVYSLAKKESTIEKVDRSILLIGTILLILLLLLRVFVFKVRY